MRLRLLAQFIAVVLIIVFGVMKLLESLAAKQPAAPGVALRGTAVDRGRFTLTVDGRRVMAMALALASIDASIACIMPSFAPT